jgi:hypothetical protein
MSRKVNKDYAPLTASCASEELPSTEDPRVADTDIWAKPHEVSGLDVAFGGKAMDLMPSEAECVAELDKMPDRGREWRKFQSTWFFSGLKGAEFTMRDGIDQKSALAHLAAIQGSWEPKHQHKEAGVAYLASRWIKSVKYA